MAAHLQEVLAQYVGPILVQYAQNNVGLEPAVSFKAVEKSIPAVLAGILSHVRDEHSAKRFFNLLTGTNVDTQWLQSDVLKQDGLERVLGLGRQWMGLLFAQQATEVQQAVAQDAGVSTEQAGQMLALAIPAVLASLKQYIQSNQYGQHQFYGQLVAQESFFGKIISPKLLAAVGIPSVAIMVAGVRSWGERYFASKPAVTTSVAEELAMATATEAPVRTTAPPVSEPIVVETANSNWMKWLLAVVVIGLAAWLAMTYLAPMTAQPAAAPVAASEPQKASDNVVAASAVASAPAASAVVASEVTASAVASAVVDSEAATDKVVVEAGVLKFYFATGSASIAPEAQAAAAELVAAAKTGQKLMVSGYNDATGSAESNEWLAKKRAQAVRTFLRNQGVPAAQIQLVKPAKTEGNSAQMSEDRRVEVSIVTP